MQSRARYPPGRSPVPSRRGSGQRYCLRAERRPLHVQRELVQFAVFADVINETRPGDAQVATGAKSARRGSGRVLPVGPGWSITTGRRIDGVLPQVLAPDQVARAKYHPLAILHTSSVCFSAASSG